MISVPQTHDIDVPGVFTSGQDRDFVRMLDVVPSVVGADTTESWRYLLRGAWESGFRLEELMSLSWDDPAMIMPSWNCGPNPVLLIPADLQKNDTEESIPMLPGFEALLKETLLDDRSAWVFNPGSLNIRIWLLETSVPEAQEATVSWRKLPVLCLVAARNGFKNPCHRGPCEWSTG